MKFLLLLASIAGFVFGAVVSFVVFGVNILLTTNGGC